MKRLLPLSLVVFLLHSCSEQPQQNKTPATEIKTPPVATKKDTVKNIYSDAGQSSFTILTKDTNSGYEFKAVEVNYKVAFIDPKGTKDFNHYFAKYTTSTKSCTDCEQQERTIKVELNSFDLPDQKAMTIQQECDDLTLDINTYKTTKFGCCGALDQHGIYDYDNRLIIEGDGRIVVGEIPNSSVKLYAGYKQETKDSTIAGTIYLSYNSQDRYAIKIKSIPLPSDACDTYSPDVTFHSPNPRDKFIKEDDQYTFWSLDKTEDKNKINNLSLKVEFDCDASFKLDAIVIPIQNGKPFGKDDRLQIVTLRHK